MKWEGWEHRAGKLGCFLLPTQFLYVAHVLEEDSWAVLPPSPGSGKPGGVVYRSTQEHNCFQFSLL